LEKPGGIFGGRKKRMRQRVGAIHELPFRNSECRLPKGGRGR
jgi:hypothetical protein